MMNQIAHRGPDDAGIHYSDQVALGFRRLAIIDVSGGRQPLANEDGTIWTVFNGEIYNFRELRRRLESKGHHFRSNGDSEILVHLYEDEGTEMFSLLRGMFSFAIWDSTRQRLILARDRLGQKPLVYRNNGNRLVFASELKALLALPEPSFARSIDPISLDHYLCYGYIPAPRTILKGVHKLPAAHYGSGRPVSSILDPIGPRIGTVSAYVRWKMMWPNYERRSMMLYASKWSLMYHWERFSPAALIQRLLPVLCNEPRPSGSRPSRLAFPTRSMMKQRMLR